MNVTLDVNPPKMPDFYTIGKANQGLKQDGFSYGKQNPITDFTREQAEEFAEMMKQEFIKHWEKKISEKA